MPGECNSTTFDLDLLPQVFYQVTDKGEVYEYRRDGLSLNLEAGPMHFDSPTSNSEESSRQGALEHPVGCRLLTLDVDSGRVAYPLRIRPIDALPNEGVLLEEWTPDGFWTTELRLARTASVSLCEGIRRGVVRGFEEVMRSIAPQLDAARKGSRG